MVILAAVARLTRPRGRVSDLLIAATGAGLIIAAFLGGYGDDSVSTVIRINQTASGSVLVLLATASALLLPRSLSSPAPGPGDR